MDGATLIAISIFKIIEIILMDIIIIHSKVMLIMATI
jgi:hypothetical protein